MIEFARNTSSSEAAFVPWDIFHDIISRTLMQRLALPPKHSFNTAGLIALVLEFGCHVFFSKILCARNGMLCNLSLLAVIL